MSILIDWDMPKACRDCLLQIGGMCRMYSDEEKRLDDIDLTIERPDWCPLIEIQPYVVAKGFDHQIQPYAVVKGFDHRDFDGI